MSVWDEFETWSTRRLLRWEWHPTRKSKLKRALGNSLLKFIMKSLKATILTEIKLAIDDSRLNDSKIDNIEGAVHSFRRRCKRIRAYLRLLPKSLAKPSRKARRQLRVAAASLSELRDAQVMDRKWRYIHEQLIKKGTPGPTIDEPIDIARQRTTRMLPPLSSSQEQLISAARLLKKAERVVSRMPSRQSNGTILVKLKQTYQDGRIATQRIVQHSCPEAFHELRKMTKQFYYQCQFVASALDRELQAEIDQARSLADKLGDALDLCVLTSNLASASQKGDESEIFAVINESQLQMATLFNESVLLAYRLFFESPKAFGRRIA